MNAFRDSRSAPTDADSSQLSSTTDESEDFDGVAILQMQAIVFRLRDDLPVEFDGYPVTAETCLRYDRGQQGASADKVFAVDFQTYAHN